VIKIAKAKGKGAKGKSAVVSHAHQVVYLMEVPKEEVAK